MVNLLKYKYKYCRKYSEDLWGLVLSKGKWDKLGKQLCNEWKKRPKQRWRSKGYKELLEDRKKLRLYYGGVKMKAYKRYGFGDRFLVHLECRLAMVVYRLNFVSSIGEGIFLVKSGYFLVNNEVVTDSNYMVQVGEVVQVDRFYREKLYKALVNRWTERYYPLPYPCYFEVNYQIMAGVLLYEPLFEEVYLPFSLDKVILGKHYI